MLLQPDTRPVTHDQLVVEVKGIYAGLAMVEAKCIEIDERQLAAAQEKDPCKRIHLETHQWQSLIALHKRVPTFPSTYSPTTYRAATTDCSVEQLLHEHHDFLFACQHPSGSPALSELATKYSMPARFWRHGIHAFLEVLRHRLPKSFDFMLTFIYTAYCMIALLYETTSGFQDTWIECLGRIFFASGKRNKRLTVIQGDLARYRMAIEDDEPKDHEVWCNTSRHWYEKAAHKSPNSGCLYHHLALLARPHTLEQLLLFTRSLTCVAPFEQTRGSIMTLFNPILRGVRSSPTRPSSWETILIHAHAILFTGQTQGSDDKFDAMVDRLVGGDLFDEYIAKSRATLKKLGAFAATSNIAALFEYGAQKSRLRLAYKVAQIMKDTASQPESRNPNQVEHPLTNENLTGLDYNSVMQLDDETSSIFIARASILASDILELWLHHETDSDIHPLVHVYLVFIWSLIIAQEAWKPFEEDPVWRNIEKRLPWYLICRFLNTVAGESHSISKIFAEEFPQSSRENGDKDVPRPLPEDFTLRGQMYSQWYFPSNWFTNTMVDDDERPLELPSMVQPRIERILWLAHRIASVCHAIVGSNESRN